MDVAVLNAQVEKIVREKFRRYICSIFYIRSDGEQKLGTGNLIKHNGQVYILTCNHVVEDVVSSNYLEISFSNSATLINGQVSLFQRDQNDDLALLKVSEDFDLKDLVPLTLEDFSNSTDLRTICNKQAVFLVVGFPADIVVQSKPTSLLELKPLFYQTSSLLSRRPTKTKMYLEYPYGNEHGIGLPRAPGISGAGIWKIPPMLPSNGVWSPTSWRLVSIQHAWNEGEYSGESYIVGSRISRLFDWLK